MPINRKDVIFMSMCLKTKAKILEVLYMDFVLTEKVVEKSKEIGKEEVAKKMIKNNEPINKIIKYTNIPKEKIIQLKQDN